MQLVLDGPETLIKNYTDALNVLTQLGMIQGIENQQVKAVREQQVINPESMSPSSFMVIPVTPGSFTDKQPAH